MAYANTPVSKAVCCAGCKSTADRQTEGVTGSHQNWRRGETKEGAAQKGTTGRQEVNREVSDMHKVTVFCLPATPR